MDEISTGLDSATTYTVTEFLRSTTHYLHLTTLVSLLQPPPEVYNLFDDVILLSDGWDTHSFTVHLGSCGMQRHQPGLTLSLHLGGISAMQNAGSGTFICEGNLTIWCVLEASTSCMYLLICTAHTISSSHVDLLRRLLMFHGPIKEAVPFFEAMGFRCPERKDHASFLQEVTTPKGKLFISQSFPGLAALIVLTAQYDVSSHLLAEFCGTKSIRM